MKEKIMKIFGTAKQFIQVNKSLCIKVLAGIILVVAIIIIASSLKGTEYGNSIGNANNTGLAVKDGGWIYYIATDGDEIVGINKVKANSSKTEKVVEGNFSKINIIGNKIYCLEYDEDDRKTDLISMKKNGKGKETLARDVDSGMVIAVDKWVYYFKNDNLYRVKLDGTDRSKISSKDIKYYQIDGNWIYYIYEKDNADYVAKMKLNGEDSEKIAKIDTSDEYKEYQALYVKGGTIYYVMSKYEEYYDVFYLYKMNKKGENVEKVCKLGAELSSINMQKNKIYYVEGKDFQEYEIHSINYDGTDRNTIQEEETMGKINIVGNWIMYIGENDDEDLVVKMLSTDGKNSKEI